MKKYLQNFVWFAGRSRHLKHSFALVVLALILLPGTARAAGLTDILTLLTTITSTIQNAIGGVLTGIQTLNNSVNNFRQQIIWPVNALNQTRGFIISTKAQYQGLMNQIHQVKNNSATLASPAQLESLYRSTQAGSIAQLESSYSTVYSPVPLATDAKPIQRNLMDMDDALAMGSLKTAVLSDQTTSGMLGLADSIEQQSATAAPGSGPMLATEAQIASLESQAYLTKVLASELRQEAAKLAHENTLLKQSAANTRNLENQVQQVLTHP
ncbi:MAG TPA: hypothetical protein VFR24_04485 [Candidatus Angelobacter sp.]|nr:hypothetical protein [Candidatus Angelobacter sp.]